MSRHAACNGMDSVLYLDTPRLKQRSEIPELMLRLRDRQPVAGHEYDPLRGVEQDRDFLGGRALDTPLVYGVGIRRLRIGRADGSHEDVDQRSVHRLAHDACQDDSRRADK